MSGPIRIVEYDPAWPKMYEEERARIVAAIGEWLAAIEHMGSTSVPGLAAKPIIDIMPGIRSLDDAPAIIPRMEALGYDYVPVHEDGLTERRYFCRKQPHIHHVHVTETTSEFWRRHLAFRDYLRSHPEAAGEYATLKHRLVERFPDDSLGYTEAKTEFILGIEEKAAAAPSPPSSLAERGIPGQPAFKIPRSAK